MRPALCEDALRLGRVFAGLAHLAALRDQRALRNHRLLPSVRGGLLVKLGRGDDARAEFERVASRIRNAREHELLLARAVSDPGED